MRRLSDLKREKRGRTGDREYDRRRRHGAAKKVRSSVRWQKLRLLKLSESPLCERCKEHGRIKGAEEVHHVVPIRVDESKAFEWDNIQSICVPCHRQADADLEKGS